MVPTFLVGSGRCGSTMISNLLNQHADILSMSELFVYALDGGMRASDEPLPRILDGKTFWQRLTEITPFMSTMVRHDVAYPELTYPFRSAGSKFNAQTGIPSILISTLPHLTADPDALFVELGDFIAEQPLQTLRSHYDTLFNRLSTRFKNKICVERSGTGVTLIDEINVIYPEARYIHMVRDGRDTAVSMTEHTGARLGGLIAMLAEYLGLDPYRHDDRSKLADVPEELRCFLPETFDREAFLRYRLPLDVMGYTWSEYVRVGFEKMDALPGDRVLTVSYERFCEKPAAQLKKMLEFIGADCTDQWLSDVASGVKIKSGVWRNFSDEQQRLLNKACAPGMALIEQRLRDGTIV